MKQSDGNQLRITEIFYSIQGESSFAGLPTVFVRLTGCPLRCHYCDTAYAFSGGEKHSVVDILNEIRRYNTPYVCVTGGEPLAQPACLVLLSRLCDEGYHVSLETSGAMDVCPVDERVTKIMDFKTPASGEVAKNRYENIQCLSPQDEVKFVITDKADYDWCKQLIQQHDLAERAKLLLSPVYETLSGAVLAEWVLQDQLPVRVQVQLHKLFWGDKQGV